MQKRKQKQSRKEAASSKNTLFSDLQAGLEQAIAYEKGTGEGKEKTVTCK